MISITNIALKLNLLVASSLERQSLEFLIWLKNFSKNNKYCFTYDNVMSERVADHLNSDQPRTPLTDLDKKPLKDLQELLHFCKDKGFIDKHVSNYSITTSGLEKVDELESVKLVSKNIFRIIGLFGGFAYVVTNFKYIILYILKLIK